MNGQTELGPASNATNVKTRGALRRARKLQSRGQDSARRHLHGWLFGVALLSVVVHLNAFGNAFVFDDVVIIQDNARIRSLSNIPEIFRPVSWM